MIKEINIPNGWKEIELGNLGTFSKGKGLSKSELKDGGYPCIRYGEIYTKHDIKIKEFYSFIDEDSAKNSKKVQLNDLLFAGSGETLSEIGKCVSYNLSHKAYVGSDIIILRFSSDVIISIYASYFINSIGRKQLNKMGSGNSVVHIYAKDLEKVKIVLPPLQEQKAIVDILEKWDGAIEKTSKLIEAKKKRFEWLSKVLIDKNRSAHWKELRLEEIFLFLKGGSGLSKDSITEEGLNKCILYGQLYTTYSEVITKVLSKTNSINGVKSKAGDILIPSSTTTTAKDLANATAILEDNVLLGGDINILRPNIKDVDSEFFSYYLTHYKKNILASKGQGVTIIHLYSSHIKDIIVDLPPLSQQKKIAKILNATKKEITILEEILSKYKNQKRGLMQQLLTGKIRA